MVKVAICAASALALMVATPALSADIIEEIPDFIPAPERNWTGAYGGLHGGWGNLSRSAIALNPSSTTSTAFYNGAINSGILPTETDVGSSGFTAGGQAGFNWQLKRAVIGVEGDFSWSGIEGEQRTNGTSGGTSVTAENHVDMDWMGTLRLRGGFASDNAMIFLTGGLAVADIHSRYGAVFSPAGNTITATDDSILWGWTVGAGAEVRVHRNISVKVEGLYFDLGDTEYTASGGGAGAGFDFNATTEVSGWIGRIGVNYHM